LLDGGGLGLYPRPKHFRQKLNRPGNAGRLNLCVDRRQGTAGRLKRARSALDKKLPWSFGQAWPLPVLPPRPVFGRMGCD
jgi:hypothetical protein